MKIRSYTNTNMVAFGIAYIHLSKCIVIEFLFYTLEIDFSKDE